MIGTSFSSLHSSLQSLPHVNYNPFTLNFQYIQTFSMRPRKKNLPFFDQSLIQVQQKPVSMSSAIASINYKEKITQLANNETYNFFMALVTVYSIFAIDFVKSLSNQPTAYIFGYIHILVITIFAMEMVLSGFIKKRYLLSFYFWIDLVSTVSMVMEITWVDNWLADNSSLPAVLTLAKVVKASRLSRIGGRAAKILLIFITYFKNKQRQQQEKKALQARNTESVNGQSQLKTETLVDNKMKSDIENDEEEASNTELVHDLPKKIELNNRLEPISQQRITERSNESQENNTDKVKRSTRSKVSSGGGSNFLLLGRKRSKIAKISDKDHKHLSSARKTFQITNIVQRLQQTFKLQPLHRINVDPMQAIEIQRKWQELIQKQQQIKNQSKQKIKSNKENFKLGESLKEQIQKNIIILIMSLIIILPLISADTWYNNDPSIDQMIENYILVAKTLPDDGAYEFLKQVVLSSFQMTAPIMYLQVQIGNITFSYPDNFPDMTQPDASMSDYMETEKIFAQGDGYLIIFNDRKTSRLSSWINIVRSCFITLLLIFSTIIFMYSIEIHALIPLESMCISINKISTNPFDALKDVNEKKQESVKKDEIQTNILEKAIWKMTSLLVIGAGEQGSSLIESKIQDGVSNINSSNLRIVEGKKIHGIFMYIKLANFQEIFKTFDENLLAYINKITAQVHEIVIKNGGIILQNDCPYFLGFWKSPQDLNIQLQTTKYFTANNPLKNLGKTIETQKLIQLVLRTYLQISIALVSLNKARMQDSPKDKDEDLFEQFILQAGIHIGDGFSGSIGSNLKIEIKCIGNDVEYTKNLCRLAGSYKISNILSQQICDILDDHEPNYVRKVDYIKQSKSENIGWLYTFDFSLLPVIFPDKFQAHIRLKKRKTSKMRSVNRKYDRNSLYKKRNEILSRIKNDPIDSVMPLNHQQKNCQKMFSYQFYNSWNDALQKYFSGEWDEAISSFQCMKQYYKLEQYNDKLSVMMLQRINKLKGIDVQKWAKAQLVYFQ